MTNQVKITTKEKVTINREYKSTVFAMLFADKTNLLSLYNALNESYYENPEALEIVTLENAIYMAMKNDNAFVFEKKLHLYEHQSTPNPNLPLRDLIYVTKEYEKLISKRTLYSSKAIKIPAPHFIVFYNGEKKQPESQVLKLSDLYEIKEEEPMLELKVRFLNINEGCNEVLKRNCKVLKEYMIFVEQIRKNIHYLKMSASEAVEKAVTECIQEDVLRDFLIANRKEVVSMSIFEYDEEREIKLIREAEYQAGVEDGIEVGRKDGIEIGRKDGIEIGRKDGIEIGRKDGIEIGRKDGIKIGRIISLKIMKRTLKDFEFVYHEIKEEELFSNLSKEDIKVLFDQA